MSEYLFAYGTLRLRQVPEKVAPTLAKSRILREGLVYGTLYDLGFCPNTVLDSTST